MIPMDGSIDVNIAARPGRGALREAGYELVCRLGEGGMGEIWAAARIGVEGAIKPCAIKMIRPAFAGDARYRRMFMAEGRVAMMLGHANIVSVFDVGVVDGLLFMAMDWVDGVDLGEFGQQVQRTAGGGPLGVAEAVHIVGALLDALGYAHDFRIAGHEHGIVHRDVSPRNVMVTSRGEIKLMDFGLAGLDGGLAEGTGPCFRGTLRYLSREQARGRPEPASDLFAVGAILHELLDGRRFRHACADEDALVAEIFDGGIPRLDREVPAPIEALRRGLLEPRAELRIKTARRALTRLAKWPGYRNRRLQLEGLYRQAIGEPRSGLTRLLSLGVRSELLDELRWRVGSPSCSCVVRPGSIMRRGTRPARRIGRGQLAPVLRSRTVEHAAIHRVASLPPRLDSSVGPSRSLENEVTTPWPGSSQGRAVESEESATAWLAPSSSGDSPSGGRLSSIEGRGGLSESESPGVLAGLFRVRVGSPRGRLAWVVAFAAIVGGLLAFGLLGVGEAP